jgi:predicted Zn-dependent protease
VAIEPGRYTTILEPQAVHDLTQFLMPAFVRYVAEKGGGPFALSFDDSLQLWRTKLGLKVVDERITIDYDITDPRMGVPPWDSGSDRTPRGKVTWIERGVLANLSSRRATESVVNLNDHMPVDDNSYSYRMSGGATSMDEMIATTKRGLLVTRFSKTRLLDNQSVLTTGYTRDGLWLVENGKISKSVKNFRYTESPLFMLNNLEQLGQPVPVFRPIESPYGGGRNAHENGLTVAIVPPLKVRDFSFTAMIDAV